MPLAQAKGYVKKPKAGGAARPLYLEQTRQPPRKRARTLEPEDVSLPTSAPPASGSLFQQKKIDYQ
jgi:hypothetical protein